MTRRWPRALIAAALLTALTGALLVAWFASGWADVRARQREVGEAPKLAAQQRGAELAHELRGELAQVLAREVDRPYFHYQNLFHDPRGSAGPSVAPSPLARGPEEPLVQGYFQLDARGATTPTINDELPALSEPMRLAEHRRFRDEVTRSLAATLAPKRLPLVAKAEPVKPPPRPQRRPRPTPPPVQVAEQASASPAPVAAQQPEPQPPQVIAQQSAQSAQPPQVAEQQQTAPSRPQAQRPTQLAELQQNMPPRQQVIDRNTYTQNASSNAIFQSQAPLPTEITPPEPTKNPTATNPTTTNPTTTNPTTTNPTPEPKQPPKPPLAPRPRPRPAPPPEPLPEPTPPAPVVPITVSPLEWRTLPFAGQPAMVAVRQVETPDGEIAQGFVIDRSALTSWLAARAGHAVAELKTGDNGSTEVVPGWHLEVAANPRAALAASADAASLARGFLARFIAAGIVAIIAALLVVLLVARSERLARERSQFAAAAAHELRTPLAGLQLYGDMLADGLGDPSKLRDYARRMSEEASRLGRVVSNVLGFSQLERGNLSVEPRRGDLSAALRELAERAEPALDRAGCTLALELPPELTATFDRDALARIVGNLLDNAEKYSRTSEDRTITLTARPTASGAEITVRDHGPGIAAQVRLFRPFARGVDRDGPAGLGLGLALSQSLARAMHGELAHRAVTGHGAAFTLTLPA